MLCDLFLQDCHIFANTEAKAEEKQAKTEEKNLTMLRIFPQVKKLKDDIELI